MEYTGTFGNVWLNSTKNICSYGSRQTHNNIRWTTNTTTVEKLYTLCIYNLYTHVCIYTRVYTMCVCTHVCIHTFCIYTHVYIYNY